MTLRILIIDDHAVLRAGIRRLLASDPELDVVGEAEDFPSAMRAVDELAPEAVLMDISMPGGSAFAAIEGMTKDKQLKVVVLTMHDEVAYLRSALAAGALGYVLKQSPPGVLASALHAARRGRAFVDPSVAHLLVPRVDTRDGAAAPRAILSDREKDALTLFARGFANKEVAVKMGVSVKTVETYRTRLTTKLGFKSRAELVKYAFEAGLVTPASLTKDE